MGFSFTALSECDMCGTPLEQSDERCTTCDEQPEYEMVFIHISTGETKHIELSLLSGSEFLWEKFARSLDGEDPLPYAWLGDIEYVESLANSPSFDGIEDLKYRQMSIDYRGEKDLRELASYEEV